MPRTRETQDWLTNNVVEWDEFGQGYAADPFRLVVCICGEIRRDGNFSDHYCVHDEQPEGWDGAPSLS